MVGRGNGACQPSDVNVGRKKLVPPVSETLPLMLL